LVESSKSLEFTLEANLLLNTQIKELSVEHESAKESLNDEIARLSAKMLEFQSENQRLKEDLSNLSATKQANAEKIHHLHLKISEVKKKFSRAESFIVEQHELDLSKALQQVKYFYNIPIDKENFDVGKDCHNGELILVEDIPYDEMSE